MNCQHKHTGSCSPAGVYLFVACMDCGEILSESAEGRALRLACPGFKAERRGGGQCVHCHHDAQHHLDALAARLAEAERLLGEAYDGLRHPNTVPLEMEISDFLRATVSASKGQK